MALGHRCPGANCWGTPAGAAHPGTRRLPPTHASPGVGPADSRAQPATGILGNLDTSTPTLLRTGYSNGHNTTKRSVGAKVTRAPTVVSTHGVAGGLSFRSGAGLVTFRSPSPPPLQAHSQPGSITPSSTSPASSTGRASFRHGSTMGAGGTATFRSVQSTPTARAATVLSASSAQNAATSGDDPSALSGMSTANSTSSQSKLTRMLEQLKSLGLAGVVSYGLLNTLWYTVVFLTVWTAAQVPRGQGMAAAAQSFLTVMAMVWAGSQVTKVARAAGALVMAPFVDRGLTWLQDRLRLSTKQQAFAVVVSGCIGIALIVFAAVVVAWS